jgi:hypothetical protein
MISRSVIRSTRETFDRAAAEIRAVQAWQPTADEAALVEQLRARLAPHEAVSDLSLRAHAREQLHQERREALRVGVHAARRAIEEARQARTRAEQAARTIALDGPVDGDTATELRAVRRELRALFVQNTARDLTPAARIQAYEHALEQRDEIGLAVLEPMLLRDAAQPAGNEDDMRERRWARQVVEHAQAARVTDEDRAHLAAWDDELAAFESDLSPLRIEALAMTAPAGVSA